MQGTPVANALVTRRSAHRLHGLGEGEDLVEGDVGVVFQPQ
jgi:hypothetical protein